MNRINNEFTRFIIVGGLNTAHYYLIYLICYNLLSWHYLASHVIAFVVSMVISFFLNVYFTYRVKPTFAKFLQFPLTQLANVSLSSFLMFVFVDLLGWNGNAAPFAALFLTVPVTFLITGKILKK
ncbi:GtrA family protein [Virgibacillus senegalensis]|uniref:GtrA family protein n=1 Tax=Virgibacillus senegalensis TaxID=1499679 RepID=UPI000DA61C49|nr:GtrA family protein [Virgibacillus senegalensis]